MSLPLTLFEIKDVQSQRPCILNIVHIIRIESEVRVAWLYEEDHEGGDEDQDRTPWEAVAVHLIDGEIIMISEDEAVRLRLAWITYHELQEGFVRR